MQQVHGLEICWGDQKAVFSGSVDEHRRPHGSGRLETKGGVYVGEFCEGRMEGQGSFDYANGNRYDGQFLDNKRHGKGTLLWARGEKYTGDFVAGNKQTREKRETNKRKRELFSLFFFFFFF